MYRILTPASAVSVNSRIDRISLAFDLANEITAEEFDGAIVINNHADTIRNRANLIVKSMYDACDIIGKRPLGLRLSVKTAIPMSRGLGSSASCVNAGVMLAYLFNGMGLKKGDILRTARMLYPDDENLEANLYGGLVIKDGSGTVTKVNVNHPYVFTLIIPDYKVPQSRADSSRTGEISYDTYSEAAALSNLFTLGLTSGQSRLVKQSFDGSGVFDPSGSIREAEEIRKICTDAGALGVFVCGDGPAMAAVSGDEEQARKIRSALSKSDIAAAVKSTTVCNSGIVCDESV
ncbi:MAG: hypothetical protein J5822_00840 [Eubacteriaceae bacterium]|nr:hypothetical protein [Eubacteriaceae bacterium]